MELQPGTRVVVVDSRSSLLAPNGTEGTIRRLIKSSDKGYSHDTYDVLMDNGNNVKWFTYRFQVLDQVQGRLF